MEPRNQVNPFRKMVFNKIFRSRIVVLVTLLACVWAIYYYILRSPKIQVEEAFIPDVTYDLITNGKKNAVALDVYYESLCPDSRSFFINELLPTVHKLNSHIYVNLIPYGKAETFVEGENIEFKCQHGQPECFGNKVHACVIQKSVIDNVLSVNVTSCLFEDYFQPSSSEKCCTKFGVNWDDVKKCAYGIEGSQLLKKHGDATNKLMPIDFIPTVALNKNRGSKSYQAAILKNLIHEVCKILKQGQECLSSHCLQTPNFI